MFLYSVTQSIPNGQILELRACRHRPEYSHGSHDDAHTGKEE